MSAAHKYPATLDEMRGGLLRIRVPEAQAILFSQPWWSVQWIPSREPALTQTAWNLLYDKVADMGLLTYFRRRWYSQMSYDMERLPVLVVDLVARAAGYPCGLAVRDPGETIYDKRAQVLTRAPKPIALEDCLPHMPRLDAAWAHDAGPSDYFLTLDKHPNM